MNKELLKTYIANSITSVKSIIFIFVVFIAIRLYVSGVPEDFRFLLVGELLLVISLITLFILNRYLYGASKNNLLQSSNVNKYVYIIAIGKLVILVPLMLILFWPLKSGAEFHHFYGFLFVFCLISICPLSSGAYFPLFIFELSIYLFFSLFICLYNLNTMENIYAGIIIFWFTIQAYFTGVKLNNNTVTLFKSRAALARANRAKADFLAVLSHEIKTPMTGILGMVDFLSETKTTKEQKDCLNTITYCASTLLNTLNDVLDASKIDAGKFSIDNVNFDFHALLQSTIRIANQASVERELELVLKIDDDVPRYIYLDPNRLQQVILNYLNNAIKFTEKGSIVLSVALVKQKNAMGDLIRVECQDTGIGISKTDQKKIFQKFSQADSSISRKYGGTGLGLSICKQIIEMIGGTVGFTSELGKGSCFYFEIPHIPAKDQADTDNIEDSYALAIVPKKILLVEDNNLNQLIARKVLEKDRHQIECVDNGEKALSIVQEHEFDLIFMDIQMPVMDGVTATREIRKLGGQHIKTPIIGLTANSNDQHLKEAKNAGMNDFVFKPFKPGSLKNAVLDYTDQNVKLEDKPYSDNNKLQLLEEEFGPEYLINFVELAHEEILDISNQMKTLNKSEAQRLHELAHDLKSITGSLGMEQSYKLSEEIEKSSSGGRGDVAFSQTELLYSLLKTEMNSVSQYVEKLKV